MSESNTLHGLSQDIDLIDAPGPSDGMEMQITPPLITPTLSLSQPKRAISDDDDNPEDGEGETIQTTVTTAPRRKVVAMRPRRDQDELYLDFIRTTLAMAPLPDAPMGPADDEALVDDPKVLKPRKRLKPGAFADQDETLTGADEADMFLSPNKNHSTVTIKKRKPTAFSNTVGANGSSARMIAPEMTDWAQTSMDAPTLFGSAFESVDASLSEFLKLREQSGTDGKLEASLVPKGGNQGPHTIAHVMTGNLMWVSLPSVFPTESNKSANLVQLPSNQIFGDTVSVPAARKIWAELENFWMGFDLPSQVVGIVKRETESAATLAPEKAEKVKEAAQKLLLSYTEWFNRIEAALTQGIQLTETALRKANPGDATALTKIAQTTRKHAESVARMIHYLWTVHPYASYCWQDGEDPDADELGGKGERGEKFVEPHRAFLEAMDGLMSAPEDVVAQALFDEARQELARNMGDMIDPYTMDHVKDPGGYWKYILGFCRMIDPHDPEIMLSEVKARLARIREVSVLYNTYLAAGKLVAWLTLSTNDATDSTTADILQEFPELADGEGAELFRRRLRSSIRKLNK